MDEKVITKQQLIEAFGRSLLLSTRNPAKAIHLGEISAEIMLQLFGMEEAYAACNKIVDAAEALLRAETTDKLADILKNAEPAAQEVKMDLGDLTHLVLGKDDGKVH